MNAYSPAPFIISCTIHYTPFKMYIILLLFKIERKYCKIKFLLDNGIIRHKTPSASIHPENGHAAHSKLFRNWQFDLIILLYKIPVWFEITRNCIFGLHFYFLFFAWPMEVFGGAKYPTIDDKNIYKLTIIIIKCRLTRKKSFKKWMCIQ